jgi:hypothetical protein
MGALALRCACFECVREPHWRAKSAEVSDVRGNPAQWGSGMVFIMNTGQKCNVSQACSSYRHTS